MATLRDDGSIRARILIWGPPGGEVPETLAFVAGRLRGDQKGPVEKSGNYELLPITFGELKGIRFAVDLQTVPQAWAAAPTRKRLLEGADGVLFVGSCLASAMDDNRRSLLELDGALAILPAVFLWTREKSAGALPFDALDAELNEHRAPAFAVRENDAFPMMTAFSSLSKLVVKAVFEDHAAGRLAGQSPRRLANRFLDAADVEPPKPSSIGLLIEEPELSDDDVVCMSVDESVDVSVIDDCAIEIESDGTDSAAIDLDADLGDLEPANAPTVRAAPPPFRAPSFPATNGETSAAQIATLLKYGMDDRALDLLGRPPTSAKRGDWSDAPDAELHTVDCSVYSASEVAPGDVLFVQVFAHFPAFAERVRAQALEADPDAGRRAAGALGTRIARGSKLHFQLVASPLVARETSRELVWRGGVDAVQFELQAPPGLAPRTVVGRVLVSQDSVPIGELTFKVKVSSERVSRGLAPAPVAGEARRWQKAFISYASADRPEVLRRVQMLGRVGIETFQDVLDLEPGDSWEPLLFQRIDEADVLFLFWSNAARASDWVRKEWTYALGRKGVAFIRPIPIEGPPIPAPPPELSALHFGDPMLYFLRSA